jgi:hypothetical protein
MPEGCCCDTCGAGYTPDERMTFTATTTEELVDNAYSILTEIQDRMYALECILAKARESKVLKTLAAIFCGSQLDHAFAIVTGLYHSSIAYTGGAI